MSHPRFHLALLERAPAFAVLGLLLLLAGPSAAHADFKCGTDWKLYRAATGVRCVRYTLDDGSGAADAYAWYGEGKDSNGITYRHIGYAAWNGSAGEYRGSAVDIPGDGGPQFNNFNDGTMRIVWAGTPYPATLSVPSWNEVWTKVSSGVVTDYSTPFNAPLRDCGPRFTNGSSSKLKKFRAYDFNDSSTSANTGVRCAMKLNAASTTWDVWYGAGSERTRSGKGTFPTNPTPWGAPKIYAHLGYRYSSSRSSMLDICNVSGNFCNQWHGALAQGTATLADTGNGIELSGGPHEIWIPSRAQHAVRLLAVQVTDSDGGRATPVTPYDVLRYVQFANEIYRPHGLEILYNRSYPGGLTDFETIANSNTNNGDALEPTGARQRASFYAEYTPTRVVAMFTWGTDASCPTAGGASSINQNYINAAALDRRYIGCGWLDLKNLGQGDVTHFAHEFGHYMGLAHTFEDKHQYETAGDAQTAWTNEGCPAGFFDGDGLDDTLEDLGLVSVQGAPQIDTITMINCTGHAVPFKLPRTNIMSYMLSNRAYISARTGSCGPSSTVATTTGSYQSCKEITSEQQDRLMNAKVNIDVWSGHQFDDFNGQTRWWRLE